MKHLLSFIKKEPVLFCSAILAIISSCVVLPDSQYIHYIDYRVLALLFCLMIVVAGFESIHVFVLLGNRLLTGVHSTRGILLILISLSFFSSMLITNDVALITFIPFSISLLYMVDAKHLLIPFLVLQTIAANMGSMLTPIGNPQNLYLYSEYNISIGSFIFAMLPLAAISYVLLCLCAFFLPSQSTTRTPDKSHTLQTAPLLFYLALLVVCLLCVARLLPFEIMLVIVLISVLIYKRSLLLKADYKLLATFFCFFIFIGNVERIPAISDLLLQLIRSREYFISLILSQFISNMPAAMLTSGFTDQGFAILYGVDIGGLGTLIASLASVITYGFYSKCEGAKKGQYLKAFTLYSLLFLCVLVPCGYLLLRFYVY